MKTISDTSGIMARRMVSAHACLPQKHKLHDILNLSPLPPGQRRAVLALVGGGEAHTYSEAAKAGEMSLGTLYTHLRRIRQRHPDLYEEIRQMRLAQLEVRHEAALASAKAHSRAYFRRQARWLRRMGLWPM